MTGHILPESANACPTSPTTDIQPELLPCPFCGGEARMRIDHDHSTAMIIECLQVRECPIHDREIWGTTEAAAITAWNTRLTSTTPTLGDTVMVPRALLAPFFEANLRARQQDMDRKRSGVPVMSDDASPGWGIKRKHLRAVAEALSAAPASPIPTSVANEGEREVRRNPDDPEWTYCPACKTGFLDTGWECNSCGFDAQPLVHLQEVCEDSGDRMHPSGLYQREINNPIRLAALSPALDNTAVEGRPSDEALDPHLPESVKSEKRCGIRRSDWMTEWFVPWSPRNDNQNAEGPWSHWVGLARNILAADDKARAALTVQTEKA